MVRSLVGSWLSQHLTLSLEYPLESSGALDAGFVQRVHTSALFSPLDTQAPSVRGCMLCTPRAKHKVDAQQAQAQVQEQD